MGPANNLYRRLSRGERGFTLVELLVVVAIIAILAAISIPMFAKYKLRGYKAELDSDAKNIYTSAQNYVTDFSSETVDSLSKLKSGGYQKSPHIIFVNGSITSSDGNVEAYSTTLKSQARDNNVVIFANGRIEFSNAP